ncbi:nitrite reductase small subunit NirD [Bordetella genomosp. 9]
MDASLNLALNAAAMPIMDVDAPAAAGLSREAKTRDGRPGAWRHVCRRWDLVANSGVVALVDGMQIALFYLPDPECTAIYAIDNRDPRSGANVVGRGIVGHLGGELVVAAPLYKQHFRLRDGQCLEDPDQRLRTWPARLNGDSVEIQVDGAVGAARRVAI